jgi:hypothetical protein
MYWSPTSLNPLYWIILLSYPPHVFQVASVFQIFLILCFLQLLLTSFPLGQNIFRSTPFSVRVRGEIVMEMDSTWSLISYITIFRFYYPVILILKNRRPSLCVFPLNFPFSAWSPPHQGQQAFSSSQNFLLFYYKLYSDVTLHIRFLLIWIVPTPIRVAAPSKA